MDFSSAPFVSTTRAKRNEMNRAIQGGVGPVVMTAFDLDTNNVYYFNVDSTEFPYGILN